jgi:hypothetical protein
VKDNANRRRPDNFREAMAQTNRPPQYDTATIEEYVTWLGTRCGPDGALAVETLLPLLPRMERRTAVAVLKQAIAVCGAD